MNNNTYSSGFIYCPSTQKILLQRNSKETDSKWTLFGASSEGKETGEETFRRLIKEFLKISIKPKDVYYIYDYHHVAMNKKHNISYAEVDKQIEIKPKNDFTFGWFSIQEISKLPLSPQTKQDIIVGKRVIDSADRKKAGEQTIG